MYIGQYESTLRQNHDAFLVNWIITVYMSIVHFMVNTLTIQLDIIRYRESIMIYPTLEMPIQWLKWYGVNAGYPNN